MNSLFQMGFQNQQRLGQFDFGGLISTAINAGVKVYQTRSEEERAKDLLDFKEDQANAAAAREEAALKIQQEALKAIQDANKPAAGTPGVPAETILGMKPTTFFIVAGGAVGVLILGTVLLMKGKKK